MKGERVVKPEYCKYIPKLEKIDAIAMNTLNIMIITR